MNSVQTAIEAIRNCDNDELNQVIEAVKLQRTYLARTATRALSKGDVVSFIARNGRQVVGVVAKVNRKTVIVKSGDLNSVFATQYRVPASMLKIEESVTQ